MNLQEIRKYYEVPVIDCCTDEGVEYRPENTLLPNGDAVSSFCLARLQFGEMAEKTIACGPIGNRRAVFIVEYYGPKGIGPATAQAFMECVICKFHDLKGVISINGPDFTALDDRPYFFSRVSFGLQIPQEISGTVTDDGSSGGGDGTSTVTTRTVQLTHPQTFAIAGDKGEIIPDPPAANTQEDANTWIVESLDALDEAFNKIDSGDY